jgi:hypothetical protein
VRRRYLQASRQTPPRQEPPKVYKPFAAPVAGTLQPLQLNCAAREEVLADLRYLARRYINWAARIFAILGMAVIEEFIELGRTQWMARNIAHYSTDQTCRHRFAFP